MIWHVLLLLGEIQPWYELQIFKVRPSYIYSCSSRRCHSDLLGHVFLHCICTWVSRLEIIRYFTLALWSWQIRDEFKDDMNTMQGTTLLASRTSNNYFQDTGSSNSLYLSDYPAGASTTSNCAFQVQRQVNCDSSATPVRNLCPSLSSDLCLDRNI